LACSEGESGLEQDAEAAEGSRDAAGRIASTLGPKGVSISEK